MQARQRIERLETHAPVWERLQPVLDKNRIPNAFLFIGPRHAAIGLFANQLIAQLICHDQSKPCGVCQACHLLMGDIHPDVHRISPETLTTAIKIDQIRELNLSVYQSPKLGTKRFIVIDPADKLNIAAANALLKMLEEPPEHTLFILIAEHVNQLPATIMSRCQQYTFSLQQGEKLSPHLNYLMIGNFYTETSGRAGLFTQRIAVMQAVCALIDGKITPCTVAAQWSSYVFADLLWFLYLLTAEIIRYHLQFSQPLRATNASNLTEEEHHIACLAERLKPANLFRQMDQINLFLRKTQQNITMNATLAVEMLLLEYLEISNAS